MLSRVLTGQPEAVDLLDAMNTGQPVATWSKAMAATAYFW
jgi:Flp pilus assembly CpaF family ATPase